jgi:hypothetical protein
MISTVSVSAYWYWIDDARPRALRVWGALLYVDHGVTRSTVL